VSKVNAGLCIGFGELTAGGFGGLTAGGFGGLTAGGFGGLTAGGFGGLTAGKLRTPNFAGGKIWWRRRESNPKRSLQP